MTDQELNAKFAALAESLAASHAENEKVMRALSRRVDETGRQLDKTGRQVDETSRQLGGLGNKFGSFTEGMALPSMEKLLTEEFHAQVISPNIRAKRGGNSMEIDVLAYSNGARNSAFLVEVKSHLDEEALEQIKQQLADFPKFFPEHRDKELYGILAGVHIKDKVAKSAIKQGIYVARISDDVFRLSVPAGFRPNSFKK